MHTVEFLHVAAGSTQTLSACELILHHTQGMIIHEWWFLGTRLPFERGC